MKWTRMDKLPSLNTTVMILSVVILVVNSRFMIIIDDIHLVTNPDYVISNVSFWYSGKNRAKVVFDIDHNITRNIPDMVVSFLTRILIFYSMDLVEFLDKLQGFL